MTSIFQKRKKRLKIAFLIFSVVELYIIVNFVACNSSEDSRFSRRSMNYYDDDAFGYDQSEQEEQEEQLSEREQLIQRMEAEYSRFLGTQTEDNIIP